MSGIIGVSPDMRSGVVGKYPTGHIVQIKYASDSTATTQVSGTSCTQWGGSVTITTTGTNDVLLVGSFSVNLSANGAKAADMVINRNGTGVFTNAKCVRGPDTNSSLSHNVAVNFLDTGATGTNIYTVHLCGINEGSIRFNHSLQTSSLTAYEIVA